MQLIFIFKSYCVVSQYNFHLTERNYTNAKLLLLGCFRKTLRNISIYHS